MTIEEAVAEIIEDLKLLVSEQKTEIEERDKEIDGLDTEVASLQNDLKNKERRESIDYQTLQLKHPRLFTGDLSRLSWADRRELFEEIYNFEDQSDALSSIEHRIS